MMNLERTVFLDHFSIKLEWFLANIVVCNRLMEHGMLSPEKAKRAHEKKLRKMKQIRMGTPVKPTPSYSKSKPESSQRPSASKNNGSDARKKKKVVDDNDDDDNFILSPKRRKM